MLQKLSFFLLSLCFCGSLGAQRAKISGYVHDVDGNPIELATVLVKHTLNGSMTNEKGFYSISVSKQDSVTLIFSCLGFNKAQRILPVVNGDRRLNVTMHSMTLELGQVYVTAIRKQTNTMESIDAKKMKLLPDPAGGSIESL
ncbi:MAG: carboxypeptidase-like regulatory domain-containing protein, partial [Massilibacteroides sp.]|nr:carboxypeptidase-like regulatory domain-containing protein [Massilibacteroides sp.]